MAKQVVEVEEEIEVEKKESGPLDEQWQNSDAVLIFGEKQLHVHSTILSLQYLVFTPKHDANSVGT